MEILKAGFLRSLVVRGIILQLFLTGISTLGQAQIAQGNNGCDFQISHQVEKNEKGSFDIALQIQQGFGFADVTLIDFKQVSRGIVSKKSIQLQDHSNQLKQVFTDLEPSTYIVQVEVAGQCTVSVNGPAGIEIKDK